MNRNQHGAVIGAGRMGVGIGLVLARGGMPVTLLARDVERARARIAIEIAELRYIHWIDAATELAVDVVDRVADLPECHLIIESIPENMSMKRAMLAAVSAAQPEAVLGTNTSSLSIGDLAAAVYHPERFAGTHFWYPPPLMPLVELVPGPRTAPESIETWASFLSRSGKIPVRLRRDIPGFIWNRLQIAVLREAKHLVESGVADRETVDLVVEQGLARRWSITGPLASTVLGGLATFEVVGRNLLPLLSDAVDLNGLADVLAGYITDPAELDRYRSSRLAATSVASRVAETRPGG